MVRDGVTDGLLEGGGSTVMLPKFTVTLIL
jgi:hypothetical protein